MAIQLSPVGLPLNLYATRITPLSVNAVGAQSNAESGQVSTTSLQEQILDIRVSPLGLAANYSVDTDIPLFVQLSPMILASPIRTIVPVVGHVSVDLTGASTQAQAEALEGAQVTQRTDGVAAPGKASFGSVFQGQDELINKGATAGTTNYELCDRTGFRVHPGELRKEWSGFMVRPASFEEQNPQDFRRSRGADKQLGSPRPEQDDIFLNDVDARPQGGTATAKSGAVTVTIGALQVQLSPLVLTMRKRNTQLK